MACAFVVLNYYEKESVSVTFQTLSGDLIVNRNGELFEIDFPAYDLTPLPVTDAMAEAIGRRPKAAYMGRDLLCVFESEDDIKAVQPNLDKVKELAELLLHITAQGTQTDCVSRTFAPKCNFPEDPVCGSGHCHVAPYWLKELKKETIVAYQASQRGGTLHCTLHGNRVTLAGTAALYSISDLMV